MYTYQPTTTTTDFKEVHIMTIETMIRRFRIQLTDEGNLRILCAYEAQKDGNLAQIKAMKPQIVAYLKAKRSEEEQEAVRRRLAIAAIPGLREIRSAYADIQEWKEELEDSFNDVGGLGVRKKPEYDFDAMYAKYPQAKAYLDAESLLSRRNLEMSAIGKKAIDMILNGQVAEAVEYMRTERNALAERNMMN